MIFNQTDLNAEIRTLHSRINEKRSAFDRAMKDDVEFAELKTIFQEIKQLEKRLELCFEESTTQQSPG